MSQLSFDLRRKTNDFLAYDCDRRTAEVLRKASKGHVSETDCLEIALAIRKDREAAIELQCAVRGQMQHKTRVC